jgi:hypothetical protein
MIAHAPLTLESGLATAFSLLALWLLVVFTRGRSFLALGTAMGGTAGVFVFLTLFDPHEFNSLESEKAAILLGCIGGAICGVFARSLTGRRRIAPTRQPTHGEGWSFGRWLAAWLVAGIMAGMLGSMFFNTTYGGLISALGLSCIAAGLLGLVTWNTSKRSWLLAGLLTSLLTAILAAGIGGIFGAIFVWPVVESHSWIINDAARSQAFRQTIGLCAGVAAIAGFVAQVVITLFKRLVRRLVTPPPAVQ